MTLDEYQRDAARTTNAGLSDDERLIDAAAGLAEEAGEVLGIVRKHLYMHQPLDRERVTQELGDVLWCLSAVATCLGRTLDEVAARNIEKLQRRYAEGYSDEASRARRD
jgi:NTP pyrophosphatase (non-canonical NTP hydrolase)